MTNNETLLPCREAFERWFDSQVDEALILPTRSYRSVAWAAWQASLSESVLDRVVEALSLARSEVKALADNVAVNNGNKVINDASYEVMRQINQALSEIQALRGK